MLPAGHHYDAIERGRERETHTRDRERQIYIERGTDKEGQRYIGRQR